MAIRSCVAPTGNFVYGIHKPAFTVANRRGSQPSCILGQTPDGRPVDNRVNLPSGAVAEPAADWIYEVPNPFAFRGATFIVKRWADERAAQAARIGLPPLPEVSLHRTVADWTAGLELPEALRQKVFDTLPRPLRLALAVSTTDPQDLVRLAHGCCRFVEKEGHPVGLAFAPGADGHPRPEILDHGLFEALANNPALPDHYKRLMVLRPGVQGASEITADWQNQDGTSRVYEYLRRNSYIPWGHFAANMAEDAVRYRSADLTAADITGLRHLYYQRTFLRLAEMLGLGLPAAPGPLEADTLEDLRRKILAARARRPLPFDATLWGWNFGFDFTPNGYRMHGSHQQVHQQYALIPTAAEPVPGAGNGFFQPYACGDLVRRFIREFRRDTGRGFFECYLEAIKGNRRLDDRPGAASSLVVWADRQVILFVPKAQTSQWELQLMPLAPVGHVLEADPDLRRSLDRAILVALRVLGAMGARLITTIEYAKRFSDTDTEQHLLYAFLPKLPESPGAFTEAQMRWILGHYPEDFAIACRARLTEALAGTG
jgi:hypothetical protein